MHIYTYIYIDIIFDDISFSYAYSSSNVFRFIQPASPDDETYHYVHNLFVIFCDDIFIYARQLHGELISVKLLTLSLYHVYIFTYTSVNISLHVHSLLGT